MTTELSTPRLRELEGAASVSFKGMADETTVNYKFGKAAGYKLALEDVAPVLAAAQRVESNLETCPHCLADIEMDDHVLIDDEVCPLGALRDALAEFKGENDA